jgi:hypothetical protein
MAIWQRKKRVPISLIVRRGSREENHEGIFRTISFSFYFFAAATIPSSRFMMSSSFVLCKWRCSSSRKLPLYEQCGNPAIAQSPVKGVVANLVSCGF